MYILNRKKEYDVVIVGSGAGGGMATKVLSEAGLRVAVIEAGPHFDPANPDQMTQMKQPYHSPRRGANTSRAFGDFDMAYGGWDIEGEPYTEPKEPILTGSDHECLEEGLIIGDAYLYALDH